MPCVRTRAHHTRIAHPCTRATSARIGVPTTCTRGAARLHPPRHSPAARGPGTAGARRTRRAQQTRLQRRRCGGCPSCHTPSPRRPGLRRAASAHAEVCGAWAVGAWLVHATTIQGRRCTRGAPLTHSGHQVGGKRIHVRAQARQGGRGLCRCRLILGNLARLWWPCARVWRQPCVRAWLVMGGCRGRGGGNGSGSGSGACAGRGGGRGSVRGQGGGARGQRPATCLGCLLVRGHGSGRCGGVWCAQTTAVCRAPRPHHKPSLTLAPASGAAVAPPQAQPTGRGGSSSSTVPRREASPRRLGDLPRLSPPTMPRHHHHHHRNNNTPRGPPPRP